jgi:CRISPR-associated protein Csb1
LSIPIIEVDFTPYFPGGSRPGDMCLRDPVGKVSSLQAPHRVADAILRDSMLDGTSFSSPLKFGVFKRR